MADQLGNPHKAALLALMGVGGEISNTELEAIAGFRIDGKVRTLLNSRKLVTSDRQGNRPFVHELTEAGWDWCVNELSADRPDQSRPLGGALYAVLGGLKRYLRGENWPLADKFRATTDVPLEALIRTAYRKLAVKPREWVPLVDLRPLLNGARKPDVDRVLKEMSRAGQAHLAPDSNRKALNEVDHAAAIRVGGEDKHLLAIEES